jgi:hypothetical protein
MSRRRCGDSGLPFRGRSIWVAAGGSPPSPQDHFIPSEACNAMYKGRLAPRLNGIGKCSRRAPHRITPF